MYFDVIDHAKLLAFFEVVCGGSWFAKKGVFYVAGVPVRMEKSLVESFPKGYRLYFVLRGGDYTQR